jgi:hypothetical protein
LFFPGRTTGVQKLNSFFGHAWAIRAADGETFATDHMTHEDDPCMNFHEGKAVHK